MQKRVLNLGAGTQSSVLLIMADRGDIEPVDVAIFSDTQAEPREVYEHLDWLEKQVKVPVVRVTAGNLRSESAGRSFLPLFVLNADGSQGKTLQKCTSEFKVAPITQYIRTKILKLDKGEVYRGCDRVEQVFGISFDERHRCKNGNGDPSWMLRNYPLVDRKLNRWQVIAIAEQWFPGHGFPRSACTFCPHHNNREWRRLRDGSPDEWASAVEYDRAMRRNGWAKTVGLDGTPFVHRQMVPLDEADLRTDDEKQGQLTLDGFANECEGMCGV